MVGVGGCAHARRRAGRCYGQCVHRPSGREACHRCRGLGRPTARNYFDRITKPAILDLFDEVGGGELRHRYGASKKHDLAASAEKLFAGDILVESEIKERALTWLPDAMRFAPLDAADGTALASDDNATDAASGEPEMATGPDMETDPNPADEDDRDPIAAAA